MNKTFTCIICPNGCEITAEFEGKALLSVTGNLCPKGAAYVEQEITNPMRNIASSVLVEHGTLPLCSVRLSAPIPKDRIMDVMEEIRKTMIQAPVHRKDVVIPDVLGLGCDVIATKNVDRI